MRDNGVLACWKSDFISYVRFQIIATYLEAYNIVKSAFFEQCYIDKNGKFDIILMKICNFSMLKGAFKTRMKESVTCHLEVSKRRLYWNVRRLVARSRHLTHLKAPFNSLLRGVKSPKKAYFLWIFAHFAKWVTFENFKIEVWLYTYRPTRKTNV